MRCFGWIWLLCFASGLWCDFGFGLRCGICAFGVWVGYCFYLTFGLGAVG